jgi:hypothetical protein
MTRLPVGVVEAGGQPDLNMLWRAEGEEGVRRAVLKATRYKRGYSLVAAHHHEAEMAKNLVDQTWRDFMGRTRIAVAGQVYGWNQAAERWEEVSDTALFNEVSEMLKRSFVIKDGGQLLPWGEDSTSGLTDGRINSVVKQVVKWATEPAIKVVGGRTWRLLPDGGAEPLDDTLVFEGGLAIDIWTKQVRRVGQEVFSLHPIAADPRLMDVKPVLFERVLREAFVPVEGFDEKDVQAQIDRTYEAIGYMITGGRLNLHKFILLLGETGTGKGVTERIIKALLGVGCATAGIDSLGDKHGLEHLVGATCIQMPDVRDVGWARAVLGMARSRILAITGGDEVPVNPKNLPVFNALLTQALMLSANLIPTMLHDGQGAVARRTVIISFGAPEDDRKADPELEDRIIATELPGILGRALDGLARLKKAKEFTSSAGIARQRAEGLEETEQLRAFAKLLVVTQGEEHCLGRAEIYKAYQRWCTEEGIPRSKGQTTFSRELPRAVRVEHKHRLPEKPVWRVIDTKTGRAERVWPRLTWHPDAPTAVTRDYSEHPELRTEVDVDALLEEGRETDPPRSTN